MRTSDERGTPAYIIDTAHRVMGGIDLDPASCGMANRIVRAGLYYDKNTNGLEQEWYGRVWLNPPFSRPLCEQFIDKLLKEWELGHVEEAIVLVNTSTGRWYHKLLERFPVVYPKHHPVHTNARIEFYPLPGNPRGTDNNSGGQAIFYLGGDPRSFFEEFSEYCTLPWRY